MKIPNSEIIKSFSNEIFELIILPTKKCNFRCTYCYEDFAIGKMSSSIVTGVKKLIERRISTLRALNLNWFGGEPMLALDIIEEISDSAIHYVKRGHRCQISAQITTNGFLLSKEKFNRLIGCEVRFFQITLDGWEGVHDQTRIQANGKGTFERIWSNLISMKESEHRFRVDLRVHFHPGNIESVFNLVSKLNRDILVDDRFSVTFKPVGHYGGDNDENFAVFSYKDSRQVQKTLESCVLGEPGVSEEDRPEQPYICYAAKANSFVIRADGRVGKCTVAFSDYRNDVGRIVEDGSLILISEKIKPWMQGFQHRDLNALSCPYSAF